MRYINRLFITFTYNNDTKLLYNQLAKNMLTLTTGISVTGGLIQVGLHTHIQPTRSCTVFLATEDATSVKSLPTRVQRT